jgi:hypothetical protein
VEKVVNISFKSTERFARSSSSRLRVLSRHFLLATLCIMSVGYVFHALIGVKSFAVEQVVESLSSVSEKVTDALQPIPTISIGVNHARRVVPDIAVQIERLGITKA